MSQPEIPSPSGEPAARSEQLPPPPGDAAAAGDRPQQAVDGEEQALESHEVIELQSFSVKKAWIEEKTKFLEQLPSIDVFVGLDAIRASAEEVPGLPTRAQLQEWVTEHDHIEKETEIFDRGELQKLRKLTKAATQRNLSPQDTDLIEITLTTIYALDKLLHLLRDRSDSLDLLGVRLTWEEHRSASWKERRQIIEDLANFLEARARWSASVYDTMQAAEAHTPSPLSSPAPPRRNSITSIASSTLSNSQSISKLSRVTRFKQVEHLNREAAQFTGRITALRHGRVAAAGKVLDKLIDMSRRPVPEELLDEQDRLEERAITELEDVGKFAMDVVMQWRKSDETYVETMKDLYGAQTLLEEIETAKLQHPTQAQSKTFTTRSNELLRRMAYRGRPTAPTSSFPRPSHPLFPDQDEANASIAYALEAEINSTTDIVQQVAELAKEYREGWSAVQAVEELNKSCSDLSGTFESIIDRLENGFTGASTDGSAPDLSSEACLEPTRHAAYLTLLPSVLEELEKASVATSTTIQGSHATLLNADKPGIDATFRQEAAANVQKLAETRSRADEVRKSVTARVARLREARRIKSLMEDHLRQLEQQRHRIEESMEKYKWRQESRGGNSLPTPESPSSTPLQDVQPADVRRHLQELVVARSQQIEAPLAQLNATLEEPMQQWLTSSLSTLKTLSAQLETMTTLLEGIQKQSTVMASVRDEFNDLHVRAEDIRMRYQSAANHVLSGELHGDNIAESRAQLLDTLNDLDTAATTFTNGLSSRIPFVARQPAPSPVKKAFTFVKRRPSLADLRLGANTQDEHSIDLPFDLTTLDEAVRSDSNSYAMRLSSEVQNLRQRAEYLNQAIRAKEFDARLIGVLDDIDAFAGQIDSLKTTLSSVASQPDCLDRLEALRAEVQETLATRQEALARCMTPLQDILQEMEASADSHSTSPQEVLHISRKRALSDAKSKLMDIKNDGEALVSRIADAHAAEARRLEEARLEAERLAQLERERQAAEAAEAARLEQERLEEERRQREEDERLTEEQRKREEEERLALLAAEEARKEEERLAEEQRKLQEEQEAEERRRAEAEEARLAAEKAERERLESERLAMEARLKETEEQLAVERQERAKQEAEAARLAAERSPPFKLMPAFEEDVFGLRLAPSGGMPPEMSSEMKELQAQIVALRQRLRSLSINELARSTTKSSSQLPRDQQIHHIITQFNGIKQEVEALPASAEDSLVNAELRSLRTEVEQSMALVQDLDKLRQFGQCIKECDDALSDLLEHIDSFPSPPLATISTRIQPPNGSPDDQMLTRLNATRSLVDEMSLQFRLVSNDPRAISENERVLQTWSELEEMARDRVGGKRSRPASVASSVHSSTGPATSRSHSRTSTLSSTVSRGGGKTKGYGNLGTSHTAGSKFLSPTTLPPKQPGGRRVVSGSSRPSRPSSRMSSVSSQRSVSGSSLFSSTFASRQRTNSVTLSESPVAKKTSTSRVRAQTAQSKRSSSPSVMSDASSFGVPTSASSFGVPSRSSTSLSSWARSGPRNSISSLTRGAVSTPTKKAAAPRKRYVADPKSKLDVAVGEVVNKLPVGINVEGLTETYKDQSGKYWIGDQEPKLCFCRILRSQTVMVRVGGGWSELSKFISEHFADSFRVLETSPPRPGQAEEKWISSATLLEAAEITDRPLRSPHTPEPGELPSFAIVSPDAHSPRSLKSSPGSSRGNGSPGLTPLQFLRRADPEASPLPLRPATPTRSTASTVHSRMRSPGGYTPNRNSVWRP
ncbi:uncharacterized protein SCHCODRAFT_02623709 [Schizophyllum commune H4-8]|uniref:GAR domain-containing protein n=1 Tax=Schizophyllum commune (strain H4-8 / FGSC 9210) TaxID=578458 RepID=D8PKB9_SCHCM|nr:uncharacterized protein SCHCODRAFT_02623709 [Schizophyllum commune H4-8]KAI5894093.1 hypothetical protein SCHCODRAFT_02623709 [Schizophyllum commune H4-8]